MRTTIASVAVVLILGLSGARYSLAQAPATGAGSILWKGLNIKGPGGRPALARKKFFLYAGGLAQNKALVDTLKAVEITSRECFYVEAKASPCLISWLDQENCESPFCRKISQDDLERVPEFKAAYDKGLGLYGRRTDLALDWIFDSMPPVFLSGYPLKRRSMLDELRRRFPPIQEVVTSSKVAEGRFVGLAPGVYTVTNLLPTEINHQSHLWAYEAKISSPGQTASIRPSLAVTGAGGVFIQKALKRCSSTECPSK